jgi:hypothetical protein
MYLSIADIIIRIKSKDLEFIKSSQQEFVNFLWFDKNSDYFEVLVEHDHCAENIDEIKVIRTADCFEMIADEFRAELDLGRKKAVLHIADVEGVLNCFLRVLYSIILLNRKGFLVHAAGLAGGEKGYLFAGRSESGKTTTARKAVDFQVLSDELVIIREIEDRIWIYSSPFKGEYLGDIENSGFELAMLGFLSGNIAGGFERLSKIDSFLKIMENIFFFPRDLLSNQKLVDQVRSVCNKVMAYNVDFYNYDVGSVIDGINKDVYQKQESSLAAS